MMRRKAQGEIERLKHTKNFALAEELERKNADHTIESEIQAWD